MPDATVSSLEHAADWDIVRRDNDYELFHAGGPAHTPGGAKVVHRDYRLLAQLLRERILLPDDTALGFWHLFVRQKDSVEPGAGPTDEERTAMLARDPFLVASEPPDEDVLSFALPGLTVAVQELDAWLMREGCQPLELLRKSPEVCRNVFAQAFLSLPPDARAAAVELDGRHASGVILPFLLGKRRILPAEYASALLARRGIPAAEAPAFYERALRDAAAAAAYLAGGSGESRVASVRELIAGGESFHLEFKSSLTWNGRVGRKDPALEHACLKTIAAFLNTAGGTLLIGIADDGAPIGCDLGNFGNEDKFLLHFWHLVKTSMGQEVTPFVESAVETIEERPVCIVRVSKCAKPVFLRFKPNEEEFYIRVGNQSSRLSISEAMEHIKYHFATA